MKIVAIDKDNQDKNTFYRLEDGRVLSQQQAVQLARLGELEGVEVGNDPNTGHDYLRSSADDRASNNIENLPDFGAAPDPESYHNVHERREHIHHRGRAGHDSGPKGRG